MASDSTIPTELQIELHKSRIRLALYAAAWDLQGIEVQTKPRRAAFAKQKFLKGDLKIAPTTNNIGFVDDVAKVPPVAFTVGQFKLSNKVLVGYVWGAKMVLPSQDGASGAAKEPFTLDPFWHVDTTADPTKANVDLKGVAVEVAVSVKKHEIETMTLTLPTWTNTRMIAEGEEILVFKAEKRIAIEQMAPPPPAPAPKAKKAKVAGTAALAKAAGVPKEE